MKYILFAACVLLNSSAFGNEWTYPSSTDLIASIELSIENCSKKYPENASKYESVRPGINKALIKKNYSMILTTEQYRHTREKIEEDMKSQGKDGFEMMCKQLLIWSSKPPTELMVRE